MQEPEEGTMAGTQGPGSISPRLQRIAELARRRPQQALTTLAHHIDLDLLLEAVFRHYGYDFRDYARTSMRRRVGNIMRAEGVQTISALQDRVLRDRSAWERFLNGISVNVSAMFRDPGGLGQVVKRGDYVSKSAARVSKILGDRVILEMTEVTGTGESRAIEKAILVNPEAAQP